MGCFISFKFLIHTILALKKKKGKMFQRRYYFHSLLSFVYLENLMTIQVFAVSSIHVGKLIVIEITSF